MSAPMKKPSLKFTSLEKIIAKEKALSPTFAKAFAAEMKRLKELAVSKDAWCVVHWVDGSAKMFGTQKECREWARKNSFNKDAPIYYAFPVAGIVIQSNLHFHETVETHVDIGRQELKKAKKR